MSKLPGGMTKRGGASPLSMSISLKRLIVPIACLLIGFLIGLKTGSARLCFAVDPDTDRVIQAPCDRP